MQNSRPVETFEDDTSLITEQLPTEKDETPTNLKNKKNKESSTKNARRQIDKVHMQLIYANDSQVNIAE
jgi:hypothetical protein